MKKITFVYGTRPEAIKIAPVINALKNYKDIKIELINTGQHRDIVESSLIEIGENLNLSVMQTSASLNNVFATTLQKLEPALVVDKPDLVVVQGDTNTAVASALCSFNLEIPVAHIEAGLRTYDIRNPFPEEINRVLISRLSSYHFCPTKKNKHNLWIDKINNNVWITGSTSIDAAINIMPEQEEIKKLFIVFTMHRRENIKNNRVYRYLVELLDFVKRYNEFHCLIPLHPNPHVKAQITQALDVCNAAHKITLLDPLPYQKFIKMCCNSWAICSDSGGVQEEITVVKRPLFILRSNTERPEVLDFPSVKLCHEPTSFKKELVKFYLTHNEIQYQNKLSKIKESPFGDGRSGERIARIIHSKILNNKEH